MIRWNASKIPAASVVNNDSKTLPTPKTIVVQDIVMSTSIVAVKASYLIQYKFFKS